MQPSLSKGFIKRFYHLNPSEVLKLAVGGVLFFLIIASYTLCQELKYGIFSLIVGTYHIPSAKLLAIVFIIPAIMLDGFLVNTFKRHQLVILYTSFFGFLGLLMSYFISHPEIGISNLNKDSSRIFGWIFFIYVEAFSPFLLGVFWAFMNSIHKPDNAQNTYGFIVSFSKLGGIIMAVSAYLFLSNNRYLSTNISDVNKIVIVFTCASFLLLAAALYLGMMISKLNLKELKGYYAASGEKSSRTGILYGIKVLLRNRYVLGIFLIVLLGDIISEILNYKRVSAVMNTKSEGGSFCLSISELYLQIIYMQTIGFFISIFLTNGLMRFLGTKYCLYIMPCITLVFSLVYIVLRNDQVIIWLYILSKAMYYTLGSPIRESLYIVTTKDIQFKAKFVIDALGTKLARNTGQTINYGLNMLSKHVGHTSSIIALNFLFIAIPLLWVVVALYVSNIYQKTLDNDEVIS